MEYLRIKEIKVSFLFSLFALIASIFTMFLMIFLLWMRNSIFPNSFEFLSFLSQELYLSLFLYPTFLVMLLYIFPRIYKIPGSSSKKINLLYVGILSVFLLKLLVYIKINTESLFLYSLESLLIFMIFFDLTYGLIHKREISRMLSFVFIFTLLPIFRYMSFLGIRFSALFLTIFLFSFVPILLYLSFEIAFFYKIKKIRQIIIQLFSISFFLLALYCIWGYELLKWISFAAFLLSLVILLSNSRINELISTKKLYKRSLFLCTLILLLSFISIINISDYFDYIIGFSMVFYSLYSFQFLAFLLDIFPSITFSLYPIEESKNVVFWYMVLATIFFGVSLFVKKVMFESMLAGYTLLLLATLITSKEAIFLSSTL